jgi:hypothetical protein
MIITNLSTSKELDGQAMAALRGGLDQFIAQGNFSGSACAYSGNSGIGSTAVAVVAPQQLNVANQYAQVQPVAVAIAGNAWSFGA